MSVRSWKILLKQCQNLDLNPLLKDSSLQASTPEGQRRTRGLSSVMAKERNTIPAKPYVLSLLVRTNKILL